MIKYLRHISNKDAVIAAILFAVILGVYCVTLAPTVTGEDSGELIAASYLTGIAHPPGYPLWCIVTKPFFLLPFGDMAMRANFSSAFWGALTCVVLFLYLRKLNSSRTAAASASLLLGFSATFWSQSVITEVYTLNTFLLVCILIAIEICRPLFCESGNAKHKQRTVFLASLLFGLSLSTHYMLMLLVAPAFIFRLFPLWDYIKANRKAIAAALALCFTGLIFAVTLKGTATKQAFICCTALAAVAALIPLRKKLWQEKKTIAMFVLGVILGLSAYLYLPLAARQNQFVNWGNSAQLDSFIKHVSRTSYRNLEFSYTPTINTKLQFTKHFFAQTSEQFTPWLLLLLPLGLYYLFKKKCSLGFLTASVFVLNSIALISVLQFPFTIENQQRVSVYYLPAYMMVAVWLCFGIAFLQDKLSREKYSKYITVTLIMLLPIIPLISNYSTNDNSRFFIAYDYSNEILNSIEQDAILLPGSDFTTFPLVYLIGVEDKRTDVMLADKYGGLTDEVLEYARKLRPGLKCADKNTILEIIALDNKRPLYVTSRSSAPHSPHVKVVPDGLVYRILPNTNTTNYKPADFNKNNIRNIEHSEKSKDAMERALVSSYLRMKAENLLYTGKIKEGITVLKESAESITGDEKALNNLGSIAAEYGRTDVSAQFWQKASKLNPEYVTPLVNLCRVALDMHDHAETKKYLLQAEKLNASHPALKSLRARMLAQKNIALRIKVMQDDIHKNPADAVAHNNLGTAYAELGDIEKAVQHWHRAIELDSTYAFPHKNLATYYRTNGNDPKKANHHLLEYQRLKNTSK